MPQIADQILGAAVDGELLRRDVVQPVGLWRIETLKSLAEMRSRAHEWLALEQKCVDPYAAFQSYSWCESWAVAFCGKDKHHPQPRIFFIYSGKTLVAILPMMVSSHMGAKILTLFGEPHSQMANAITMAGVDCTDGLRLCIAEAELLNDVDVVALGPLPENTALAHSLDNYCLSPDPAEYLSLITWPGIYQSKDYISGLKRSRRKVYTRKLKGLKKLGAVKFDRYDACADEFKPLVGQALTLKKDWLKRNGLVSLGLSQEGVEKFLNGFVNRKGGFEVEVEALSVDNQIVALGLNLVGRNMRNYYLTAYDPAFIEFSPGTLLLQFSVQNTIDEGMKGVNFLGHPTHFKNLWASEQLALLRYQQALTFRGKIWLKLWIGALRPAAKSCLTALRFVTKLPK